MSVPYFIARYQPADFTGVLDVINAAAQGDPLRMMSEESLCQQFEEPGTEIAQRGLVARTEDGQIVGFGRFRTRDKRSDPLPIQEGSLALHPAHVAALGSALIPRLWQTAEEISRQQGEDGFIFQLRIDDNDTDMLRLIESLDLHYNRLLVTLELDSLPLVAPPSPVAGIAIRASRRGVDEQAWYAAYADAFADHWGQMVWPAALWEYTVAQPTYAPELNLIAWDTQTDEIAGFCYTTAHGTQGAFRWVGVRPRWRRRGLGDALTKAGLRALYGAGVRSVAMGADYESDTGPARIYENNGFRVIRRHLVFCREFRLR